MKPTWGVPVSEIQRGIKNGVRKINIDTDNRMAMTGQIRKVLKDNPEEFDPRKYLKPAMEAMAKLCKQRLQEFNTAGPGRQDQEGADHGRNGQALHQGRARPAGRLTACAAPRKRPRCDERFLGNCPRTAYFGAQGHDVSENVR